METQRRTLSDAFDLLLKIQSSQARNTFAQTRCSVQHLRPWFTENAPYLDTFETDFEEIWAMYRAASAGKMTWKGKPRKLEHDRRYLVMGLKRAQTKGWIKRSFTKKDFVLNEVHEEIGRALSDDESNRLLKSAEFHPRTRIQIMMALTMGMRHGEILKLRVEEVNLEKRIINLDAARVKTRKPRKVPIPISNPVLSELTQRVRDAKGTCVFPMESDANRPQVENRHQWNKVRRDSGVKCRFHDLRHTWASNMISMGAPQDHIVKVGGFTAQVMSRVYSHMQEDAQNKFRSAFDERFGNGNSEQRAVRTGNRILLSDWRDRIRGGLHRVVSKLAA